MKPNQNPEAYALAIDAGGTFFKSALVSRNGELQDTEVDQTAIDSGASGEKILAAYFELISKYIQFADKNGLEIAGIAVSTPGPFDFENATSYMEHKFQGIYGVNLREKIVSQLNLQSDFPIKFLHDAHSFLLGEIQYGAAKTYNQVIGVTLGTGLGFGYFANGELIDNGKGGPCISIYKRPYQNGILEDIVSGRGIVNIYKEMTGNENPELNAHDVSIKANAGDAKALEAFSMLGNALGNGLASVMEEYPSECVVCGGQISKSFDLFKNELIKAIGNDSVIIFPAKNISHAPLLGAATTIFNG